MQIDVFFGNVWVLFVILIFLHGCIGKIRSRKYIKTNPELEAGYKQIFFFWVVCGNIPWVIIGLGNATHFTESFFEYFNPISFNPFVIMFNISFIFLWCSAVRWIYFKNGAEFLEKHPGFFARSRFSSDIKKEINARQIKINLGIGFFNILLCLGIMWVYGIGLMH